VGKEVDSWTGKDAAGRLARSCVREVKKATTGGEDMAEPERGQN